MPPASQPTPQAIAAATREVRRQTVNNTWRYQSGRWIVTVRLPSGRLFDRPADTVESARFNSLLRYYQTVFPPPAPPPPPPRQTIRQRLFGQGATGSLNPLTALRNAVASRGIVGVGAMAAGGVARAGVAVVGVAARVVGGVIGAIGGAVKLGGGILLGGLALVSGVLFGFVKVMSSLTREMTRIAREITSIRNNTGASTGKAMGGYLSLRAAGLSGEGASAFLGSDSMRGPIGRQIAGSFGLPDPLDPRFAAQFARKSQSMSIFQRRAMADALSGGQASPELLQLQNTRPEIIEREQKYQSRIQGALGVTPEAIRRLSDEYPLLQNRVSMFTETVKMRFLSSMLPAMEQGLDKATAYLEANSGKIANAIQAGTRWLYVEFPFLLLRAARVGLSAAEMFVNGIYSIGDGIVNGLRAFEAGQSSFMNFFVIVGRGIDMLTGGVQTFAVGAMYVKALMNNLAMYNPVDIAERKIMGLAPRTYEDPMNEAKKGYLAFPATHFADQIETFRKSGQAGKIADAMEDRLKQARAFTDPKFSGARGALDEIEQWLGPKDQREAEFTAAMKDLLVEQKKGNKDIVGALRKVEDAAKARASSSNVLGLLEESIGRKSFEAAAR